MNNNQLPYLHALGIIPWQRNTAFPINTHAKLMIVNDSSHRDSERAESLLTKMLQAIGIDLNQVKITTIQPNTIDLDNTIARHQPSLLLALGQTSAQLLLNSTTPLNELREQIHTVGAARIPMIVTFHPADLLHAPRDKKQAFSDLQIAARMLTL